MIRSATMSEEVAGVQVFVDGTGRRKRLLAVVGFFVALFAALYIGVVGASVVQAADAGLTTKASLSTTATATATASASSSTTSS
ncbi:MULTISPECIES: hypothetical protein [Actinoplanes]|uniref:hypothetical protein n=1 Tax=Actinoplanes TaxID=1865 RepID=UPI0005F2C3E8|nr:MULTISPECIES: hypothetical protein [Actinoplanes]GLY03560.1 hypothetical protein Acsp01_39390 [Actinoplanes sp. NBRC 101535]